MIKGNFYAASVAVVVGLFLAGCSALRVPSGQAQGEPGVSNAPAQVARAVPAGGPSEGIKVHGNWVIEVRNPDGALVTRREFQNALNSLFGPQSLAGILARQKTPGLWVVKLGSDPVAACSTPLFPCVIAESGDNTTAETNLFKTLTVNVSGANSEKVELKGSATAANTAFITSVSTFISECPPTTPPATSCQPVASGIFTGTGISPGVPVSPGQQIQVTVTISFS